MNMTTLTRDCKRDNVAVNCPNATTIGFGQRYCKRGYWVLFKDQGEAWRLGRAIGRVRADGKIFIEVAVASETFSNAFVRWADPKEVVEVRREPPRRVFNFFAEADWNPDAIFRALEHGVSDLRDQQGAK